MNRLMLAAAACALAAQPAFAHHDPSPKTPATKTPIKHLVVIFQENETFDHYFGTYPNAVNQAGEPAFTARARTPAVNGISAGLISANANKTQPFRLDRKSVV